MFVIKNNTRIEIKEIPQALQECFGRTRSRNRVGEILKDIHAKEAAFDRHYLEPSATHPRTYSLADRFFVDKRATAVLLLEARVGRGLGLGDEVKLEDFKRHVKKVFGRTITGLDDRIRRSRQNGYLLIVDADDGLGSTFHQIREDARLRDDLEYLILLSRDFLSDLILRRAELSSEGDDLTTRNKGEIRRGLARGDARLNTEVEEITKIIEHIKSLLYAVKPGLRSQNVESLRG